MTTPDLNARLRWGRREKIASSSTLESEPPSSCGHALCLIFVGRSLAGAKGFWSKMPAGRACGSPSRFDHGLCRSCIDRREWMALLTFPPAPIALPSASDLNFVSGARPPPQIRAKPSRRAWFEDRVNATWLTRQSCGHHPSRYEARIWCPRPTAAVVVFGPSFQPAVQSAPFWRKGSIHFTAKA